MRRVLWAIITVPLFACAAAGAEVPAKIPAYTFARVKLAAGERCFILRADDLTQSPEVDKLASGEVVFTGPPAKYVILAWTEAGSSKHICEIESPGPAPGPSPVPPGPQPDPAVPILPDEFGLAPRVYRAAVSVRLRDPRAILAAAGAYRAGAAQIVAVDSGDLVNDVSSVVATIKATCDKEMAAQTTEWVTVRNEVNAGFTALWKAGRRSRADHAGALREVATALEEFSKRVPQ